MKLYGVKSTQFLIMTSIATTGHNIQGCSTVALISNTFEYGFSNWIYVALSRVRKFSGLFLLKKLDLKKLKPLHKNLLNKENRLKKMEEQTIKDIDPNFSTKMKKFLHDNNFDMSDEFDQQTNNATVDQNVDTSSNYFTSNSNFQDIEDMSYSRSTNEVNNKDDMEQYFV